MGLVRAAAEGRMGRHGAAGGGCPALCCGLQPPSQGALVALPGSSGRKTPGPQPVWRQNEDCPLGVPWPQVPLGCPAGPCPRAPLCGLLARVVRPKGSTPGQACPGSPPRPGAGPGVVPAA